MENTKDWYEKHSFAASVALAGSALYLIALYSSALYEVLHVRPNVYLLFIEFLLSSVVIFLILSHNYVL